MQSFFSNALGERAGRAALVGSAVLAYSAVATGGDPRTLYTRIFTAIPGAVAFWFAIREGWHRFGEERYGFQADELGSLGLMVWSLLITLLTAWILAIFFSHPRSVYPTLSHLTNLAFQNHPVRTAGFLLWMALGWYLLRR